MILKMQLVKEYTELVNTHNDLKQLLKNYTKVHFVTIGIETDYYKTWIEVPKSFVGNFIDTLVNEVHIKVLQKEEQIKKLKWGIQRSKK